MTSTPGDIASKRSGSFRPDIQGLRAIAVGGVVLYHAGLSFLPGGYVGVDVFFVISGFLITSHLLRGLESRGRIAFADFYAKRARRILPASFVVLVLTVISAMIWMPPLALKSVFQGAVATALYVPNYLFAAQGTNYLSETAPSVFQHYWSLGIEEQFYLFWPAILATGFVAFRNSRRSLFCLVLGLVLLSFIACIYLTDHNQPWAFFSLPTRAWELGVGGLCAFLVSAAPRWLKSIKMAVAGWLGVAGIVGSVLFFNADTQFPGYAALLPVAATALVLVTGSKGQRFGPTGLLSVRPMLFIGEISYSLYLVHWPILVIVQAAVGQVNVLPIWITVALALLSVAVAFALNRLVENPARGWKMLTKARARKTLVSAGLASVIIVAVSGAGLVVVNRIPLNSGQSAPAFSASTSPSGTAYVPENLKPTLANASDDNPSIYDDGCHRDFASTDASGCMFGSNAAAPIVALFGDSHAAQWFPALNKLAQEGAIRIDSNTKSSCPSVTISNLQAGNEYVACEKWRSGVISRLSTEKPALILLANYGQSDLVGGNDDFNAKWQAGLQTTIESLPKASRVAVLGDTPNQGQTPAVCLSANLTSALSCGRSRGEAVNAGIHEAEASAALSSGATYVDLTDYLCSATFCPAVIGDELVYRDAHHMTASFSASLSPVLAARVQALIPAS